MDAAPEIILLSHVTDDAAVGLSPAVLAGWKTLKERINNGHYSLYQILPATYFVTETFQFIDEPKRLIVHCFAGENIAQGFELLENAARRSGYASIEFPTHRKGMGFLAKRRGYKERAIIYRKDF